MENLPVSVETKVDEIPTEYLSGRVLLAEDNIDNQELLLIYLNRMGVNVTVVENGLLAVEAVNEHVFDLVLMDLRMPIMGGLEAITVLRNKGIEVPIVALTANAMKEDRDACFKAGCNGFLTKPIDVVRLNSMVEKYLDIKKNESTNTSLLISTLLEEDPGAVHLIKKFVNNFIKSLNKVESYIQQQQWDNLADILHQIKGTGGNFGYPDIYSIVAEMEFHVESKNADALNEFLSKLRELHRRMVLALE